LERTKTKVIGLANNLTLSPRAQEQGGLKEKELENLRAGFVFSLITLAILVLHALLSLVTYPLLLLLIFIPLFLAVPVTWAYSLHKRVSAWRSMNQKWTARSMIVFGTLIFLFLFPTSLMLNYPSGYGYLRYGIMFFPLIAWGAYTFLESQGLKLLKEIRGIDLTFSGVCGLTGFLVCIFVFTALHLFPGLIAPAVRYFDLPFYRDYFVSLTFASPLLFASCITTIRRIREWERK
jgi:hypothetical protein